MGVSASTATAAERCQESDKEDKDAHVAADERCSAAAAAAAAPQIGTAAPSEDATAAWTPKPRASAAVAHLVAEDPEGWGVGSAECSIDAASSAAVTEELSTLKPTLPINLRAQGESSALLHLVRRLHNCKDDGASVGADLDINPNLILQNQSHQQTLNPNPEPQLPTCCR